VHPAGWVTYLVRQGDTLATLAASRGITPAALVGGNCLTSSTLSPGTTIYLPPAPTRTPTRVPTPDCGRPPGWIVYTIVRGDTLYSLARRTGTTVAAVRTANCLSSNAIYVGQALYLPALPPTRTSVPSPTPAPTATPSTTPTATAAPTNTAAPTDTPGPTGTATTAPSLTPSATISPTLSAH